VYQWQIVQFAMMVNDIIAILSVYTLFVFLHDIVSSSEITHIVSGEALNS